MIVLLAIMITQAAFIYFMHVRISELETTMGKYSEWANLVASEIDNPLTLSVNLTRSIEFDKSYGSPLPTLTVVIRQKGMVEDYGNAEIHGLNTPEDQALSLNRRDV